MNTVALSAQFQKFLKVHNITAIRSWSKKKFFFTWKPIVGINFIYSYMPKRNDSQISKPTYVIVGP